MLVGDTLPNAPWQLHHIFPNDTFDPDRGILRAELEQAEEDGDEVAVQRTKNKQQILERKVYSLGNLAFLMPPTNQSIGNRRPADYLREIAQTDAGRKSLEAQLIPLDHQLWKHEAFDQFCFRRCQMLAQKAKELFFSA